MAVKSSNRRPRVLSGIQPSGTLHLGNYLGALRPWAARQELKENYFCIADMHALNEVQNPETLRRLTREAAAVYLAAGLDPSKSTIFVQSHVRAHAECCWILNCVTPLGWLDGETFVLPKPVIPESGARIRAFNDPAKKMSKTEAHLRGHAVNLIDEPDEIRWVISQAVT